MNVAHPDIRRDAYQLRLDDEVLARFDRGPGPQGGASRPRANS